MKANVQIASVHIIWLVEDSLLQHVQVFAMNQAQLN